MEWWQEAIVKLAAFAIVMGIIWGDDYLFRRKR